MDVNIVWDLRLMGTRLLILQSLLVTGKIEKKYRLFYFNLSILEFT